MRTALKTAVRRHELTHLWGRSGKMKRLGFVLAAVAAVAGSADARVRWQGQLMFTGASASCGQDNPTGGFIPMVRYRPPVAGTDNGPASVLSFFSPRSAESFRLPEGRFNHRFKTVETMSIGDGFGEFVDPVQIRFTSSEPAVPTEDTDFIEVEGSIKGYNEDPDCIFHFKMTLFQRIE
jgi:hypothetical protein